MWVHRELAPYLADPLLGGNRGDYDWARMRCDEYDLYERVRDVLFSPSHHELAPRDLADWIVSDRLPVRMQMQMHKLLWGDVPGH